MSFLPETQTTSIATHTNDDIFIRDKSLCHELIGKLSFTEMIVFQVLGRQPTAAETHVIDACLITLMEHGLTPSALATRLVYSSATEAMQGAVAAGLLGVGSLFVGTSGIRRLWGTDRNHARIRYYHALRRFGRAYPRRTTQTRHARYMGSRRPGCKL